VTGSKYLLESSSRKMLIDAGLFQGDSKLEARNDESLPVEPRDIDSVLLTHAHLDHTGYLPKLVKSGLTCPIHCTHGTKDLTTLLLMDSATIQEEDLTSDPLYTLRDVEHTFHLLEGHPYKKVFKPVPGWSVSFKNAGHILGSSWIDLRVGGRRIVFSGDLGKSKSPLLQDPTRPRGRCDVLFLESTYGNKRHRKKKPGRELKKVVRRIVKSKGSLVIPAFAVERTQEIAYLLEKLLEKNDIPSLPIYVDSPMASRVTLLFQRYQDSVLEHPNLRLCSSVEQSREIAYAPDPKIIIASSGMATAGRVLYHLHRCLPESKNQVLLVGYQSRGTRGSQLERGAKKIELLGDQIPVKAKVKRLEGFSGHADRNELRRWAKGFSKPPKVTFLVHGEPKALRAQQKTLKKMGWNVKIPQHLQRVNLEKFLRGR